MRNIVCVSMLYLRMVAGTTHDFMVMGDWGGIPIFPYKTPGETGVARELGKLAGEVNASYTLSLGDNFYLTGVKAVDDARFRYTFEDVFTSNSLLGVNHFRVLAGNHDHYGNCSAEIAYTAISPRWHYPSYYYDFTETLPSGSTVHHVMIDTIFLSGQSVDPVTGVRLTGREYTGPADVAMADAQWQWINSTLRASTADYLIVAGHYPVWSICEHGPTIDLVSRLKPILEASRTSVYLAGHDHCSEHLDDGGGVQYHGVGAGNVINPSMKHQNAVPPGSLKWHYKVNIVGYLEGAFAHAAIGDSGLIITHYSSSGKKLYEAAPIAPRTARLQAREHQLLV